MSVPIRTKEIVSVAEMARMCGLSRTRFYQLVGEGVFPSPVYDLRTRRPFFTEQMQAVCLEVRQRNAGNQRQGCTFLRTSLWKCDSDTQTKGEGGEAIQQTERTNRRTR
jgi:hypothetical protein